MFENNYLSIYYILNNRDQYGKFFELFPEKKNSGNLVTISIDSVSGERQHFYKKIEIKHS